MALNKETKVGIMVAIVLTALGILTFQTGKFAFKSDGYIIKVHFKNIDGVNMNSPVMYNGYEVGIVQDIQIMEIADDVAMELTLWLQSDAVLREGATAHVKNLGFMGEKYIGLESGDTGAAELVEGAVIAGTEPQSIEELVKEGKIIAGDIKGIMQNLNERLTKNKDHIDNILAQMDTTMTKMSSFFNNADERLEVNKQKIDDLVTHMHGLSVNLEEMSQDLKNNPWKLLHKPKGQ